MDLDKTIDSLKVKDQRCSFFSPRVHWAFCRVKSTQIL